MTSCACHDVTPNAVFSHEGGGHWDFRFCSFGYFSVFRFLLQKTSVFRFWWSLRFADFSFFSIWFSVFVKNTSGFSVLVPDVVFHIIFSLVQGRDMEGQ